MTIVACDPGMKGGLAVWCDDAITTMPFKFSPVRRHESVGWLLEDLRAQITTLNLPKGTIWYQEEMVRFAGNRHVPSSYAANYAHICGFLFAVGITYGEVMRIPPQQWMKALGTGTKRFHTTPAAWKNHLKAMAQKFYPNITVTLQTADALLLLRYAVMRETGVAPMKEAK